MKFAAMLQLSNFLRSMVEKHHLANYESNYTDWLLKLNIVLRLEDLQYIMEDECPEIANIDKPTDDELELQKMWNE